jgi:hypothetical protein
LSWAKLTPCYPYRSDKVTVVSKKEQRDQYYYWCDKVAIGVGVELRKNYLPGYRSHYLNDAAQQISPNSNYITEERGLPFFMSSERQQEGVGTNDLARGDGREMFAAAAYRRSKKR